MSRLIPQYNVSFMRTDTQQNILSYTTPLGQLGNTDAKAQAVADELGVAITVTCVPMTLVEKYQPRPTHTNKE